MFLKSVVTAIVATLMLAESASALSCARPDLARTMEKAKSSDKFYYVLVGKFRPQNPYDNRKYPSYNEKNPGPQSTMMWFDGRSIAKHPWQDSQLNYFPVEVRTSCAGPWCSSPPQSGENFISFVEVRRGQAPLLHIGPCPEWMYRVQPRDGQVQSLRDCMDKPCKPTGRPDYY